jgi:hypothetical protein
VTGLLGQLDLCASGVDCANGRSISNLKAIGTIGAFGSSLDERIAAVGLVRPSGGGIVKSKTGTIGRAGTATKHARCAVGARRGAGYADAEACLHHLEYRFREHDERHRPRHDARRTQDLLNRESIISSGELE